MSLSKNRYIADPVKEDIRQKMVFIGGPRQVGKTTLALYLLGAGINRQHPAYLNWDIDSHRRQIIKNEIPAKEKILVFDEIHKYARWRSLMKGFYDEYYPDRLALVTGSARLDYYRKGGDSLQGRYFYYRLHPYSLMEITNTPSKEDLEILMKFGGFPEPLSKQTDKDLRRCRNDRLKRVLLDDLRDLERVNEISLLELLIEALPSKVGSPLSLQSLREDLQVSHDSIRKWLTIFDNLYLTFRISPFGSPKIRAVKKEQKLYLWDWTNIDDPGARFENLVACQLLKYCHFLEDSQGHHMELRFIRDTDRREIDFVVLKNNHPIFAVECKSTDKAPSDHCRYFRERTNIDKFFQVHLGSKDFGDENINTRVLPFVKFVKELDMP